MVHHQNQVGILDGAEPMGNDKAGFPGHEFPHGQLHLPLGAGVHIGSGFVQNEHFGIVHHGPGNGQKLLLSLGDIAAVFGNHGLVSVGQAHDEGVDMGAFCGGHHLIHGGILLSVGYVLENCAAENPGVLENHGVDPADGGTGIAADRTVINADFSAVHIVIAHEQTDDGGFSGAGGAYDCHGFSGLDL